MLKWTKKQARDYLVDYHMINTNHHYTINDVFNRLKSIQYDPLNVVGTNPELVLQSRVHNFKTSILYDALYKQRYLIDAWDKQMCIYKTEDFQYFNPARKDRAEAEMSSAKQHLNLEFAHIIDDVYQEIKENGPILSSQINIGETKKHQWGNVKASSITLSYLFHKGVIGIESRNNTQKKYDLIERIYPDIVDSNPFTSKQELIAYYLLRRIQSMGLAWNKNSIAFSGLYISKKLTRSKYLKVLLEKGLIEQIEIEDIIEPFYIPNDALNQLTGINNNISILAPLDNMLWDRTLVKEIFDFDYTWEVYTPSNRRKYGYYVLPILRGSDLIGRVEFDQQRNHDPLKVLNIWWEPNIKQTKQLELDFNKALKKFAKYLEVEEAQL